MGKRIIAQRRGKGSNVYKAAKRKVAVKYLPEQEGYLKGEIVDIFNDRGRPVPIAKIVFDNGKEMYNLAAEGVYVGQKIEMGEKVPIEIGNISNLRYLPEGCPIFNIELNVNDGGKLIRAGGTYALLVAKDEKYAYIKLRSGKNKKIPLNARATIGNIAGSGRKDKPMIKAGVKYYAQKAKGKKHVKVRGVAMNATDHPFGGAQHHPGKSKSTARNAPPGRKVGAIASSRTGRRKK